ncbi:uncharacterized protein IUM83_14068 [Phytophthora cinnamomi]|uniref:uncharacterized protein n=1 Tax=Phytophthora cinnamomi TaxID=4785 RepID=UPI003559ECBF|nr:hypothetical protein IUM83_14068 [Phytophthora cinnamomi]
MEQRKEKERACRKAVVAPVSFKLHTELLAERRIQQRGEREVAQLRHAQQKIMGKKTVEDFAQIKLLRRETAAMRSRSLHCNGRQANSATKCKRSELLRPRERDRESSVCLESRPLQSAREAYPRLMSRNLPQRPQSAKPVLQTHSHSTETLGTVAIDSAQGAAGKQTKAHTSKKNKKRKTVDRKPRRLEPSSSTPELSERSQSSPTCKKINIIVNMRNLQLHEGEESPVYSVPPPAILAWGNK